MKKSISGKCDVLVGGQWGDEGKAKIIDYLANNYNIICRYQGGSNAGHTVIRHNNKYVFHLLPSGILNPKSIAVLGNGMVIHLPQLLKEIRKLQKEGIVLDGRLLISDRAFVVTEYHREFDKIKEKKDVKIGTTSQGIGPAYTDKYSREGIRISDLFHPDLLFEKITASMNIKAFLFKHYYGYKFHLNPEEVTKNLLRDFTMIKPYVDDTVFFLNQSLAEGNKILLEGAQGAGLDIDFGSYPYVTSSSPTLGGSSTGSGIPAVYFQDIIGIFKAYVTRVGEGSLPTQLSGIQEEKLRQKGREFGATTGRSRGCGWFDGVQAKLSVMVNGINKIALTKLDVLTGFETVKFCTHYRVGKEEIDRFPTSEFDLGQAIPVYREFPGWDTAATQVHKYEDLHPNVCNFINFLEEYLNVPVTIISTGPDREHTLEKSKLFH